MGLNLNDYEYALPNTITGSIPYGTQTWSASDYFQSEVLIVPHGRTYKIEMIRITNGVSNTSGSLSVQLSRSLSPNVWVSGAGYNNESGYYAYPEVQSEPTMSTNGQVVFNNHTYDQGHPHDQYAYTPYGGRTQYLLWSWQDSGSNFYGEEFKGGATVLSEGRDGPLWLNSEDAIQMWQGSTTSTTNGQRGQNFRATYTISYIEYF